MKNTKIERRKTKTAIFGDDDDIVHKVKRQLETSKSTVCSKQIVDLVNSKSSISMREIVNFDA